MWTKIKWGIRIVLILLVAGFLHYTLPQTDIVRITRTYNQVTVVGSNWMFYSMGDVGTGAEAAANRDIRFIDAVFEDNRTVQVYRNEDTGWIWPPYFKYDSSNLQAEATNLVSTAAAPQWVAVTHYGWRLAIFSIYPNAVGMRPVAGPDVTIIPWVSIIVLIFLAFAVFMLRRMWLQFWERMIDPAVANAEEAWDAVDARADAARARAQGLFGRIGAWFASWRSKPRR
jgi:hypothetical protein